jgi:hypothetical protein
MSRPGGAVGINRCILVCISRNDGALRAGKKLYIYLCGLCVARDTIGGRIELRNPFNNEKSETLLRSPTTLTLNYFS